MTTIPPTNRRASCPAEFVEDFGEDDTVNAGYFHFADGYDGTPDVALLFGCPCGCGALKAVNLKPYPADKPDPHPVWQWDGNRESPTLTPSILIHQMNERAEKIGEHWHGFLTAGEFRSC